ncbi:DivIVA domain-containing protein [Nonomuraea phyllanthi]|uniref:Cell wall synthesis protein Wag31 n=1 Tax=Nonomuraea phyllanthi TaxID=2219224 RepID=A0A5C4WWG5_9ACTN|nr:DivIVA domain-containing protein [Nonomuraea phyllanthi]KAB8197154.1 DivIVA domain-containing protein [Nonomuraea phyllanthi]
MTDSMEPFPPPGQPLVANANGNGHAAAQDLLPWSDAGESNAEDVWEEPAWDEPQAAPSGDPSGDRLTPAELRAVVFRRAPLGKRGLDEHQVNSLLDRVEAELVRLTQEKRALETEVELLRDSAARQPEPVAPPREEPAARPQETGLARVDQAEHAASRSVAGRVQEAHVYAASLLSQAQQTADQYIKDAQRYSRELIEDALLKRGTILSNAAAEGDRTVGVDAVGQEIARLRTANQTYRGKLRDYFELMLMNLDEWETAEGAGGST